MNIKETKDTYKTLAISKVEFINKMYDIHKVLFDFSVNLNQTEIAKIEIENDKVFFTTRPTDYHPGGCKFFVDAIDKRITPIDAFNFDIYEKHDSSIMFKLLNDGDLIFDIGANIGWYSCHFAKKLPNSLIYSFEPIPETFDQLKRNILLNGLNNIRLNNIALSAKKERLPFYYSPEVTGASSTQNITENSNMIKLECESDTIDNIVNDNKIEKINFIKCDVEGAEYFVFQGGFETFKNLRPIVFTEMLRKWCKKFGYHPNDIIDYFYQFGYHCFISSRGSLVKIEKIDENTLQTNFFFLDPSKHSKKIHELA